MVGSGKGCHGAGPRIPACRRCRKEGAAPQTGRRESRTRSRSCRAARSGTPCRHWLEVGALGSQTLTKKITHHSCQSVVQNHNCCIKTKLCNGGYHGSQSYKTITVASKPSYAVWNIMAVKRWQMKLHVILEQKAVSHTKLLSLLHQNQATQCRISGDFFQ